jgi:hypothetical protein
MFHKSTIFDTRTSSSVRIDKSSSTQNLLRNLINTNQQSTIKDDKKLTSKQQRKQAATISGINVPLHLASSEFQINNLISTTSTKTTGSTICMSKSGKINTESVNIKPGSTNLTTAKRKRGSLFNLFSFQKPNLSKHDQQKKINDENEAIIMFTSAILPPPPPEFADLNNRKNSYSGKSSIEGSLKQQHRSIFNALRRKSVKSMPITRADSFKNSISSLNDTCLNINTEVVLKENVDKMNNIDLSDAESTISNLFSFDNYISSTNYIEKELNYAQESSVEDESCQLDVLCNDDNNMIEVRKEKIKKYCRNKQVNKYVDFEKYFCICMIYSLFSQKGF